LNYEIKRSNVCDGLGLYAFKDMNVNDYIGEYVGVYLDSQTEFVIRANIYDNLDKHFGFTIIDYTIDASYFGNNTRFINHNIE
jgi:SET domain-containing protein